MDTLTAQSFRFHDFELDVARRLLLKNGSPVTLKARAFDLLLALVESRGQVLSKDDLLAKVWPGQFVEEGNLKVHISALRKVFGEGRNDHRFILTVPGRGYSFVGDINDDTEAEVTVETHRRSRVIVEEEINEGLIDPDWAPIATTDRSPKRKVYTAMGVALILALAVLAGGWLYRWNTTPSTFAFRWIDPERALKPQQLTTNGKVAFAALSPDGEHFAYTIGQTDKPSLWYAHTNGKQQVQIRQPEQGVSYHGLTFSPDGNEIYYVARDDKNRRGALFRISALGGTPQRVLTSIDSPVTFSPDGKELAFIRTDPKRSLSIIVIADIVGEAERELASRHRNRPFTLRGPSWSPDGKHVATGAAIGNPLAEEAVLLVNTVDGSSEMLGTTTFNQVRRVAWLRDGSGMYVNAVEKDVWDDRHLWLIEYPSGNAHKVTQDLFHYGMFNLSVSDDGSKVLSVSSTKICNIFVSPADDLTLANKVTANSLGKQPGAVGMTWAGNDKIVYGTFFDQTQSLWSMDADGSDAKPITPAGFVDRFPSVSNSTVVFASSRGTEGGSTIWRTSLDGGDLKHLAKGNRPSVTPDGQWVLYGALSDDGSYAIWKVPIDGGDPTRLTFNPSGYVRVSPSGKMFACSYNAAQGEKTMLAVFPIEGGQPLHVFDLVPGASLSIGIRWSLDERSLIYRDAGPNLWKQNLTGGDPEKFIEFPDEVIYAFDWSPDGKYFAVARGEDVRDVVMVTNDR